MENQPHTITIASPIGPLKLKANNKVLTSIQFLDDTDEESPQSPSPLLHQAKQQLTEYFEGNRSNFDLPLQPSGSDFEKEVWHKVKNIRFGTTSTYSDIAKQLGDVKKVRAVGRANGQNPIPIIIPCHRVIGANNKLTGYAGGIKRKQWLLQHEGAILL